MSPSLRNAAILRTGSPANVFAGVGRNGRVRIFSMAYTTLENALPEDGVIEATACGVRHGRMKRRSPAIGR